MPFIRYTGVWGVRLALYESLPSILYLVLIKILQNIASGASVSAEYNLIDF